MNEQQLDQAIKLASRNYNTIMSHDKLSNDSVVYMARNPELDGCKAQGATPMEAINNLRDARIDYIYYLLEDGLDVPAPRSQLIVTGAQLGVPQRVQVQFPVPMNFEDVLGTVIRPNQREDSFETWSRNDIIVSA